MPINNNSDEVARALVSSKPRNIDSIYVPVAEGDDSLNTTESDGSNETIPAVFEEAMVSPELDPWALPDFSQETHKPWKEMNGTERVKQILTYFGRAIALLILLYIFICSLDLLSSAFRLLGGKSAGEVFRNSQLLQNPVAGLMIGVVSTVLLQSSSTSTSILVSMTASGIVSVRTGIPIIMGANIGTSMTNTLVSVAHSGRREEFRRAFAGATVHDMFNWLTVIILLPLEVASGYLYRLTSVIVASMHLNSGGQKPPRLLKVLTDPLSKLIIQLDKSKISAIATGQLNDTESFTLVKRNCYSGSRLSSNNSMVNQTEIGFKPCRHIFSQIHLNDPVIGAILLMAALGTLIGCLLLIVKNLNALLKGQVATAIRKTMNSDFPGRFGFLSGYLAIVVGSIMTILLQSSSVFTSALTPLVGIGILSIERMYPLTLGSNVGTTFTSVLAALASPPDRLANALQLSLCHLFFNISGILLFYPIPVMRKAPIGLAKLLGNKTAKYRWFAVVYVILMFAVLPLAVFGLSMVGSHLLFAVGAPFFGILLVVALINLLQANKPSWLPNCLKTWERLPKWMHSLEPMDRIITKIIDGLQRICPFCSAPCCCPEPSPTSLPYVHGASSRRQLLATSQNPSRSTSRANSRASSPKFQRRIQAGDESKALKYVNARLFVEQDNAVPLETSRSTSVVQFRTEL